MNSNLSLLLGGYLSTMGSSLIMNIYLSETSHRIAKKESMRKIKYKKNLYYKTKRELRTMEYEHIYDMINVILYSLIPVGNVVFTIDNIQTVKEMDDITIEVYNEIVEDANKIEDEYRKNNMLMLKSIRDSLKIIPDDINLDDNNTRLTKKETKKVLKLNKLNYDVEMLKYEKENNLI